MSFNVGEVFLLTEEHASGWWHGRKEDAAVHGFFPEGFVTTDLDAALPESHDEEEEEVEDVETKTNQDE